MEENKNLNLDDVIKLLNKKYGENSIISGDECKRLVLPRVSTGSLSLDIETGGGLPNGRLIEIFGSEGSGKTSLAIKIAAEVQKIGKKVVWVDAEGAFDPIWAEKLGMNLKLLRIARPEKGEVAADIIDAVVRSGECGLVVLDSVAAVIPNLDLETSMVDPERLGDRAKLINRLVRKLQSALNMKVGENELPNDCTAIFINQIREKIGIRYGNPETTPGGRGLRFHASIRVHVRRGDWIEKDSNKIGHVIKFRIVKNKTYPPYRTGMFDFYFDGAKKGQIDNIKEVVNYATLKDLLKIEKRTYYIGDKKLVGKQKMEEYLKGHPKLVEKLRNQILDIYFKD